MLAQPAPNEKTDVGAAAAAALAAASVAAAAAESAAVAAAVATASTHRPALEALPAAAVSEAPTVASVTSAHPRPEYKKPPWAGKPSPCGDYGVELIVRGEVKRRVPLNVEDHSCFLFGRAKDCDVVLDGLEPRASRFHCVLQCKEGSPELYMYDLKSAHGTLVNGRRIDPQTFQPVRVGEQIRFNAVTPALSDCTALICGPEEAMVEEGEVDLSEFRDQAVKERAEVLRREQADLARRKEAKRRKLHEEAQRNAVVGALAARAQLKMNALKDEENRDREKLHQVTWGMADDAVELPDNVEADEDVANFMGADGIIDTAKIREKQLTVKQEQLVTKLEQKIRRLTNLQRERTRFEERAASAASKVRKKGYDDLDTEFESLQQDSGGINIQQSQQLEEKLEKVEDDVREQTDNLLLSLGLRRLGESDRLKKRRAALYDTRNEEEEDEFFDRTSAKAPRGGRSRGVTAEDEAAEKLASEYAGLPSIDTIETKATLESKAGLLNAERARIRVQLTEEAAKERQRTQAARDDTANDSLDAFMSETFQQLRNDRQMRLQRRLAAVEGRADSVERMLVVARRNSDEAALVGLAASSCSSSAPGKTADGSASAAVASTVASAAALAAARAAMHSASSKVAPAVPGAARASADVAASGLFDALALMKEKGVLTPVSSKMDDPTETSEGDKTVVAAASSGAAAPGARRARIGPARPPDVSEARAAVELLPEEKTPLKKKEDWSGPPQVEPKIAQEDREGSAKSSSVAAAVAAATAANVTRKRTPNAAHINPEQGGLQLMAPSVVSSSKKRSVAEISTVASAGAGDMLPPPEPKKVYGVSRRPQRAAAPSRDADLEASGELDEPEG
eukprot:TRINITY_DN43435_c0_g1_i1.p1 TRINITY_DN43435_c0_g1~~TRINITY_DN43435_c0_g1_i1.p1  ORF type:complete len:856 (+),score=206.07 TRINITY_DN43435_c0_g1_i1:170-2737(+)